MSRKRKHKKQNAGGVCAVLSVLLILLIVAGALFYLHQSPQRPELPAARALLSEVEELFDAVADFCADEAVQPDEEPVPVPVPAAASAGARTSFGLVQLPAGLEYPLCAASRGKADHELRRFADYALCYRESYEEAEWSAYCLEKSELVKNASRSNDFRPDPEISTGSAELSDYRRSGYDRGHLAPAADFAYSESAMSETFYMSNMTPQAPAFNRDIWQKLEAQVRVWAAKYGRAYVVTGPVLAAPPEDYDTIGENKVVVPRAFYKVVLVPLYADEADAATPDDASDVATFAFIIPNQKCDAPFYDYAVTVSEVEERTGLDFFYLLDDAVETRVESMRQ